MTQSCYKLAHWVMTFDGSSMSFTLLAYNFGWLKATTTYSCFFLSKWKTLLPSHGLWQGFQDSKDLVNCLWRGLFSPSMYSSSSSSSSSSLQHEIMLTMTFLTKSLGKQSSNVTTTRGSCLRRSTGWTLCFLLALDLIFSLGHLGFVFLPCLSLGQSRAGRHWLYFLGLCLVTNIHPLSSLSGMSNKGVVLY